MSLYYYYVFRCPKKYLTWGKKKSKNRIAVKSNDKKRLTRSINLTSTHRLQYLTGKKKKKSTKTESIVVKSNDKKRLTRSGDLTFKYILLREEAI